MKAKPFVKYVSGVAMLFYILQTFICKRKIFYIYE